MRNSIAALTLALLILFVHLTFPQRPPETPVRIIKEDFFGTVVEDPYRWLENVKDPEVLKWLTDQNAYTRSLLDAVPENKKILARIQALDSETPPPLTGFAADHRGLYYYYRSDANGISKGYVLDPKSGIEKVVIDPEKLSMAGQAAPKISRISPSPDGRYVAFLVRGAGRSALAILETASGKLVEKPVENVLGFTGLDWDSDSKSIYIVKLPALKADMKPSEAFLNGSAYRHVVGTDQAVDQPIVLQGSHRGLKLTSTSWPFVFPTPDGKHLAVWVEDGARSGHALYTARRTEILSGTGTWKKIADFEDGATGVVFHKSTAFITMPQKVSGLSQITRVDVVREDVTNAQSIDLPSKDAAIADVQAASDALYVTANDGIAGVLYRVNYGGKAETIEPPIPGALRPILVTPDQKGGLFGAVGWTRPMVIYRYDDRLGWQETDLVPRSDLGTTLDLQVEQVQATSHDGVAVPLTLIYKRGLKRDSSNPVYMIGYGSYGANITPGFDNVYVPWFEAGGILAHAHTRGGGEFGEAWHMAGSKERKPNTWLDFIACAEYLIDKKYTSPAKLAGGAVSAGGILIGRSITERPDLFAAALISVATTDMLRAEYQMNGPANVVEFGTTKERAGFEQLLKMSTYHHVKSGVRYPAIFVSSSLKDTNVDAWQPAKIAARFQAVSDGSRPALLRVDPEAGHDQYGSTRKQIQELRADQLTFLFWQLGMLKTSAVQ